MGIAFIGQSCVEFARNFQEGRTIKPKPIIDFRNFLFKIVKLISKSKMGIAFIGHLVKNFQEIL
jgi:hypothetical protein